MPIYLIESDCTNKELFVSLESIRKYILICLNRLNETTCKGKASDAGGMGLMIAFTPFEGKKEQVDAFNYAED
jgi:hypothetical protein